MVTLDEVKEIIGSVLQLGDRIDQFDRDTALLGSVPEFDSMAVVSVITAIEDNFGIIVDDDEVSAELFETVGNLYDFVAGKLVS
ncbi:MAG: acyl carrier protein [Sedimenticola sp.]|nr:acyl carrier protein [Sedimenticola sp.]MCW8883232.1 acyl carrier protein [Sedimenticola sp.]MCW8920752.1 acyl carrier protein [Sedimenticola sp.]MCW8948761.1 acyl carrier protein [Sedimenticola sp.]MCW8975185.1 acyl carrier protein [Sedimenticola sp.]